MLLRLHPQEPHLSPIEVSETLFTIGRSEQAFAEFDRSAVARLSRRHAKLFEQDGAVYVADLNSRNGTMLNGQSVDAVPQRLADGDQLEVGKLIFRIELEEAAIETEVSGDVTLVLEGAHQEHDLAPIVVSRFPFLVSRDSEIFTRYMDRAAKQVEYVSAKHAHFYLQNNQIFVEDLNSTNGTLLNDAKVSDQPQAVRTGDLVAFGGDFFEYRIRVLHADDSIDRTVLQDMDRAQEEGGTIFVDSPTSFIDIFDTQDKMSAQPQPSLPSIEEFPDVSAEHKSAPQPQPQNKKHPAAAAAGSAKAGSKRWLTGLWVGAALVLLGGGIFVYQQQPSSAKLEQLLYEGDYVRGAQMAKALIADGVSDGETQRLATMVLLRASVPAWLQAYQNRDVPGMSGVIEELRASGTMLPELHDYAQLLEWAAETQTLLNDTDVATSELTRLRNWWVFNSAHRQRTLDRLVGYVPEAAGLQAGIQAQLRKLQAN